MRDEPMSGEPKDGRTHKRSVLFTWALRTPLLLLVLYVGAYFGLSERISSAGPMLSSPKGILRRYPVPGLHYVFVPAAWVEAKVKRHHVSVGDRSGTGRFTIFPDGSVL
jgi:hypothetical protein